MLLVCDDNQDAKPTPFLQANHLDTKFHQLRTLANQTIPKVKNTPNPALWLQSTKPK